MLPVMFGFFIMGFVDVVGIATNYVSKDFNLSETMSGFLPMMVFLWFAVFSIPTGIMMGRLGRKNTVVISMVVTIVAMMLPMVSYSYAMCLVAFALMGIGNTILQVSLNPLISNVVSGKQLTSSLTMGQFVKAIASFLGPILAAFAAASLGSWKMIFPIYAAITVVSTIWLAVTRIPEQQASEAGATFGSAFGLLKDPYILLLFLGILFVVGMDVGMNWTTPKVLMERTGMTLEVAGYGTSLYFVARTAGAFLGALLLLKVAPKKVFTWSMFVAVAAYLVMMFAGTGATMIYVTTFLVGFFCANIFSIIFSFALQHKPSKANEISGLMIMGVAGGAIFPALMGVMSDSFGGIIGSMYVVLLCLVALLFIAFYVAKKH